MKKGKKKVEPLNNTRNGWQNKKKVVINYQYGVDDRWFIMKRKAGYKLLQKYVMIVLVIFEI